MKKELAKQYDATAHEDGIYKKWEESGFFNPDNLKLDENAESYTVILPPPNITAKLHLGHSAMLAIQDLLVRFKRMNGYRTLWLPGTDHAAIATQNVVEKRLLEKGITRHELGREKFLEEVDVFLKETQATILNQTRKMGASLDWSRLAFTLDDDRKKAVKRMFLDMYKEGVIVRGERVVNWCPRCNSTLADDEVEHKDQKANFYTFKYNKNFPISISTTRPETKLGDTAVAVNPKDERYKEYIGKTFDVNFCGIDLKIKIIADRHVDMEFGTGALGVTPAHSMVDSQMAEANDLEVIKVVNEDGKIHEDFGEFSGLYVKEARKIVVEKLKEQNLIDKEEEIDNSLSICYRCDHPIEPLPSKQWFVDVDKKLDRLDNKSIKEKAIEAGEKEDIKFYPERFGKTYDHWMKNLHNWCISRQIWFGHRIPIWYKGDEVYAGDSAPEGEGWVQDEDTLDTWFSSGMWTFSTLGWPDNFKDGVKTGDLAKFHPTQVLETGHEILTLWVSRMIMMSFFALGEKPFSDVYLHGMILDDKGKKMSKSKGNGIDPIDVIEKFGTDAVRLSLLIGNTPGNSMKLSEEKIGSYRNFANKLWNISRFILSSVDEKSYSTSADALPKTETISDKWIVDELLCAARITTAYISSYDFSLAGEYLKDFTYNKLADWYLESSKFEESSSRDEVLIYVLKNLLKLWHPMIPFVTEVVWDEFNESILMVESWPKYEELNREWVEFSEKGVSEDFKLIQDIIVAIRNVRAENKVEPTKKLEAVIYAGDKLELIKENEKLITKLKTGIESLEIKESGPKLEKEIYANVNGIEIYLLGAIDTEKEKIRLEKEIDNLDKLVKSISGKLNNKEFVERAPEAVVAREKERMENAQTELNNLKNQLNSL